MDGVEHEIYFEHNLRLTETITNSELLLFELTFCNLCRKRTRCNPFILGMQINRVNVTINAIND